MQSAGMSWLRKKFILTGNGKIANIRWALTNTLANFIFNFCALKNLAAGVVSQLERSMIRDHTWKWLAAPLAV
jgi:hypothetical protein